MSSSPTAQPSVLPTVIVPSSSPSVSPSMSPSLVPSLHPTVLPSSSLAPTDTLNASAILDFKLPLGTPLDFEAIAVFEETLEEFLQEQLSESSEGAKFIAFNVTVVSQKVVTSIEADEDPANGTLSNADPEPIRRSLEEMSLIISVLVNAIVSPLVPIAEIDIQADITRSLTRKRARFFEELFATEAFEGLDPTQQPPNSTNPSGSNNTTTATIASTVAGGVVLGSVALLFFVRRKRRARGNSNYIPQKEELQDRPLDYAGYDDEDEISSLGNDEMFQVADNDSKVEIGDDGADKWSLDDAFPFQRAEGQLDASRSQLTDSDDECNDDMKDVANPDEIACESTQPSTATVEENSPVVDDKEVDEDDAIVAESRTQQNAPKSIMKSMLNFSCFADNTLGEQMDRDRDEARVEKSSVASDSRLYSVFAPPGPLGLIVDNSPSGGTFIAEVKDASPLKHMVGVGDKIVQLDGVDTRKKSAVALGQWIAQKPYTEEQVLVLMAKDECRGGVAYTGDDIMEEDNMSV